MRNILSFASMKLETSTISILLKSFISSSLNSNKCGSVIIGCPRVMNISPSVSLSTIPLSMPLPKFNVGGSFFAMN